MHRIARFMEHFWLALAIATLLAALWVIAVDGFEKGGQWLFFPAIALAMFFYRRFARGRIEAMEQRKD
jgi:bacteriorhodopsin